MWKERIGIILIACLLDLVLGDPHRLWHPVRGIGRLISLAETWMRRVFQLSEEPEADRTKKRVAGTLAFFVVLTVCMLLAAGLLYGMKQLHPIAYLICAVILSYQMLAACSLRRESMKVYRVLVKGNLSDARKAVSMIVGRDTERLTEEGVTKATVETVAENTSDGVIAPLFYLFLFGPVGAVAYKTVNTMDSMLGYKNDRYRYFGTFAARADDVLNYVPARLSACLMIAATVFLRLDTKGAIRVWRRDRRKHASPNSAQTESVCAGALGVQLAGDAYYFGKLYQKPTIGDDTRAIEPRDIRRANALMYGAAGLMLLLGCLITLAVAAMIY